MNCEETQIEISSWLDGEIAPWDALPLADHLLACGTCAAFYARARRLDKAIAMAAPSKVAELARSRAFRLAPWALPLAATVLLALGGFALARQTWRDSAAPPTHRVDRPSTPAMTDDRFLGITRELLDSAPRYRSEMLRVMSEVAQSRPLEGSIDTRARENRTTGGEGGGSAAVPSGS